LRPAATTVPPAGGLTSLGRRRGIAGGEAHCFYRRRIEAERCAARASHHRTAGGAGAPRRGAAAHGRGRQGGFGSRCRRDATSVPDAVRGEVRSTRRYPIRYRKGPTAPSTTSPFRRRAHGHHPRRAAKTTSRTRRSRCCFTGVWLAAGVCARRW
jgi:hypothetical protein